MHVMISQFRLTPDGVDECVEAIEEYVSAIKAHEPGVLSYASYQQPDGVTFTQVMAFRDGKAEVDHRDTKHGRKFMDSVRPHCDVPPSFTPGAVVAST